MQNPIYLLDVVSGNILPIIRRGIFSRSDIGFCICDILEFNKYPAGSKSSYVRGNAVASLGKWTSCPRATWEITPVVITMLTSRLRATSDGAPLSAERRRHDVVASHGLVLFERRRSCSQNVDRMTGSDGHKRFIALTVVIQRIDAVRQVRQVARSLEGIWIRLLLQIRHRAYTDCRLVIGLNFNYIDVTSRRIQMSACAGIEPMKLN